MILISLGCDDDSINICQACRTHRTHTCTVCGCPRPHSLQLPAEWLCSRWLFPISCEFLNLHLKGWGRKKRDKSSLPTHLLSCGPPAGWTWPRTCSWQEARGPPDPLQGLRPGHTQPVSYSCVEGSLSLAGPSSRVRSLFRSLSPVDIAVHPLPCPALVPPYL